MHKKVSKKRLKIKKAQTNVLTFSDIWGSFMKLWSANVR